MSPKLIMLGPLSNETVNLKTDSKSLYYSLQKLKYSPSIKRAINQSIFASYGMHTRNNFASLGIFMHQGCTMQR